MGNATELHVTYMYMYMMHVRPIKPIHIAATALNRTEILENCSLPTQFSSLLVMRTGLYVSRQCYKQDLY